MGCRIPWHGSDVHAHTILTTPSTTLIRKEFDACSHPMGHRRWPRVRKYMESGASHRSSVDVASVLRRIGMTALSIAAACGGRASSSATYFVFFVDGAIGSRGAVASRRTVTRDITDRIGERGDLIEARQEHVAPHGIRVIACLRECHIATVVLALIHISEPTRQAEIS